MSSEQNRSQMETLAINAIRVLSAEGVQKAKSGHPGMPLGVASLAYELWASHMRHNPADPNWLNRDRFVLSAGHASMLLYSLLHLFGYGLKMEDLAAFRQWNSLTPGHPEYRHTKGVEMTTGPLGQGFATAVGMAMAEAHLAARFNKPGAPIFDHFTYVLSSDGCMMEGATSEAASLAGHLKLGKLIVFYDDNEISIEGDTALAFTEDVNKRFEAYGWQVLDVADGEDRSAISAAIKAAKADLSRPSLIVVHTQIGYGSPLAGSAKTHGEPLGEENLARTKANLKWPCSEPFCVPAELTQYLGELTAGMSLQQKDWEKLFANWRHAYPDLAAELDTCLEQRVPDLLNDPGYWDYSGSQATRATSGICLNRLAKVLPGLIGGSADLAPSTRTEMKDLGWFGPQNYEGRNIHFGVREFAMTCISNGLALHGGLRPFCATFFVFSDYMKPAIRLTALMQLPVIFVLTHDSIGVGEDGPTHEPIEQLTALRATPNVTVFRPADGKETAAGYLAALNRKGPTCLVLSRQNLPTYEETGPEAMRGGYILRDTADPQIILIASGSEVEATMGAADILAAEGVAVRVVSMPSMELFAEQDETYRESVLPASKRCRLAVEAGTSFSWHQFVGLDGDIVGIDRFGASAPYKKLFEEFGFTAAQIADRARKLLKR